jgi:hypothetical protein
MRKIIICIIMMLPVFMFAQTKETSNSKHTGYTYELSVESGFGSYLMSDLKDLQNTIISKSDIPIRITTSFPSYFNYSIKFGTLTNVGYEGITGGLMSTGARSSVSDYSGYYANDINCMALHIGYYSRKSFANYQLLKCPLEIGYILNGSLLYSFVTLKDNLKLYGIDELINESNTLNSMGLYSEPMIYATYMFSRYLGIEINAGGALSLSLPLYYKDSRNVVTIYDKNRFANWSGYRVSIGLISRF